ncbi:MAG: FAD-dependent oxidoreductase [bacterium]|nr:FAD-dependent oxidoreductase [bacterium]
MHYVIVGNSYAGIAALEAIREIDKEGRVALISDEEHHVYSRPLISYYLAGKVTSDKMFYRPENFYKKNKVETLFGKTVTKVYPEEKKIQLNDQSVITFDKLLVATGGKPFVPLIKGLSAKNIFTFTKYDDAKVLGKIVKKGTKVVIVGGGLIGLKAAEGLNALEAEVSIVELGPRVLALALDEISGEMLNSRLTNKGIRIITKHTVSEILSNEQGEVSGVILDDKRELGCEVLVVAIGVRPNMDLLKDTSINVNRGILVNEYMQTSDRDIFAAGDVVETYDMINEKNNVIAIVPLAFDQGRIAGFNMATGLKRKYLGGLSMNSVEVYGLPIMTMGLTNSTDDSQKVLSYEKDGIYRKLVFLGDNLVGVILVGDVAKGGMLTHIIKSKKNVSSYKDRLINGEFSDIFIDTQNEIVKACNNL